MPWVRVDDKFDEHPKLAKVGPLGIALWIVGLAYCNRNLTDGFIPWATAQGLLTWQYLDAPDKEGQRKRMTIAVTCGMAGDDVDSNRVIELLVEAGLWELRDGGYSIHDYADYQPTKAEVEEIRQAAKERMKKVRQSRGTSEQVQENILRSSPNPVPDPVPNPVPDPVPSSPPKPPSRGARKRKNVDRSVSLSGKFRDKVEH